MPLPCHSRRFRRDLEFFSRRPRGAAREPVTRDGPKSEARVPPVVYRLAANVQPVGSRISAWLQSGARPTTTEGVISPNEQEHYSTSRMAARLASLDRFRGRDRGFTRVGGSFGFGGGVRLHLFRRRRRHRWRELGRQGSGWSPRGAVYRVPWLDLHQPRQRHRRPYRGRRANVQRLGVRRGHAAGLRGRTLRGRFCRLLRRSRPLQRHLRVVGTNAGVARQHR
jgi:hypothetical protein